MNYTFKLSRRLARFRAAVPIAAAFLTLSCAGDPSGLASDPGADPASVAISPDSVSLGVNQAVQFNASTDATIAPALSRSGKGRGRKIVVSVAVAPQSTTVSAGASNRFSATAMLSDGSNGSPSLSWTATGGRIDQTGLYTAGTTAGTYQVIAAASNGIADTAAVTVAAVAPVAAQLVITPATDTLPEGATAQFAATGKASDGTTVGVSPLFTATGGSVTAAGVYTAGQTSGTYRIIATDQVSGLADTSGVTITPTPAVLQSIALSPTTVTLASAATQQFTASGKMSDSSTSPVAVTWSASGGTISSAGLYTAGSVAGSYRVIGTQTGGGLADTSAVTITVSSPTLQSVVLTPASVTLQSGATQQYAVSGRMSDGSTTTVNATVSATGGTITSGGLYTAGSVAGSYRVIATQTGGGLADTSAVTITASGPTLQSVVLTPASVTLQSGATQQYAVSGRMSDGSTTTVNATVSATGGTITSGGLYTAGSVAGSYRVIATQTGGGLADTSAVTITASGPTLQSVVLTPASVTLQSGATQQYAVSGRMSDGSTTTVNATYSATGGTITSGGLYTAGTSAGVFRVIATQQGGTKADTASVTVTTPPPPPSGSCARTVNANATSELTSALSGALPGDCINLAPGTYTFASALTVSRSGTAAQPITIQGAGSGSTVLDMNLHSLTFLNAPYVHIQKLRVTNLPQGGWWIRNSSYAVLDNLEVDHSLNEMIAVKDGSHHVIIQNSWFHDTGTLTPYYGEALYFGGSGMDASHPIDCNVTDNQVLNNRFGPNVRSNSIDIKPCANGTIIRGNTIDGTGTVWDAAHGLGALIDVNGSGTIIEDNTFSFGNPNAVKFYAPTGGVPAMSGSIARNNTINLQNTHNAPAGSYFGFNRTGATYYGGVTISCTNVVTNGPFGTNPCTP